MKALRFKVLENLSVLATSINSTFTEIDDDNFWIYYGFWSCQMLDSRNMKFNLKKWSRSYLNSIGALKIGIILEKHTLLKVFLSQIYRSLNPDWAVKGLCNLGQTYMLFNKMSELYGFALFLFYSWEWVDPIPWGSDVFVIRFWRPFWIAVNHPAVF